MLYLRYIFYALVPLLFFISCSSTPPQAVDGSDEKFAHKAISIVYTSSKDLNSYDKQAHAVPLVIYQLKDINAFNTFSQDKAGIIKLLEAKKFDKSVMYVSKYYISPNETKELLLNRATKTAWVAMVVGYYDMQVSQSTLKYQTPSYSSLKFWDGEESQKFLKINVYLDKFSMQQR